MLNIYIIRLIEKKTILSNILKCKTNQDDYIICSCGIQNIKTELVYDKHLNNKKIV